MNFFFNCIVSIDRVVTVLAFSDKWLTSLFGLLVCVGYPNFYDSAMFSSYIEMMSRRRASYFSASLIVFLCRSEFLHLLALFVHCNRCRYRWDWQREVVLLLIRLFLDLFFSSPKLISYFSSDDSIILGYMMVSHMLPCSLRVFVASIIRT